MFIEPVNLRYDIRVPAYQTRALESTYRTQEAYGAARPQCSKLGAHNSRMHAALLEQSSPARPTACPEPLPLAVSTSTRSETRRIIRLISTCTWIPSGSVLKQEGHTSA